MVKQKRSSPVREAIWVFGMGAGLLGSVVFATIPTTIHDFFLGGTQPGEINDVMLEGQTNCRMCHGDYDDVEEPWTPWAASMMGQSARDPLFHAALAIANQDAAVAGDLCIRCHVPSGWVEGRSLPPDLSGLLAQDFEGVSCHTCHRMVDPANGPGAPLVDQQILANLVTPPGNPGSGNFVLDPMDRRRGPFDLGAGFFFHEWLESPFHTRSQMCATCHDVSNPAFTKQANGTYALGPLNTPHPTGNQHDMFPLERTYSEWLKSDFADGPIDLGGRFGGNNPLVGTCQDCHMPETEGKGCRFGEERSNLPQHHFNGGNTWVLRAIRNLYPDSVTQLTQASVDASIDRAEYMLENASDMELTVAGQDLNVRIINQTGHKLPTGYPEGRRMWINVKFRNAQGSVIAERGAYNTTTAVLTAYDTKVYEAKLGVDAAVSALSGVPVGPSFHFAINNLWYKDNRIPPRGFSNAEFASVGAAPVAYTYADGVYWDNTLYAIPQGATSAEVSVYYQTASKEYVEFLRDANTTNNAGNVAYQQWELLGKSAPVLMDHGTINLCYANCDNSTVAPILNVADFTCFLQRYAAADPYANCDGSTTPPTLNVADFTCFLQRYAAGCQ
jgi:hypothetical protein